jgi:hypothetical protein
VPHGNEEKPQGETECQVPESYQTNKRLSIVIIKPVDEAGQTDRCYESRQKVYPERTRRHFS